MQQKTSRNTALNRSTGLKIAVSVLLLAVGVYILASHWHTVRSSLHVAAGASIPWLVVSGVGMSLTFCIAAGIYCLLALHTLRYWQTVLVEWAVNVVNRLLPWGIGGLGVHGVYLYRRAHTAAEATVVVSVNNALGIVANVLLIVAVVIARPATLHGLVRHPAAIDWRLSLPVILVIAVLLAIPPLRRKLVRFGRNLLVSVRQVRPVRLLLALGLAALLTCTYTFILYAVSRSLGLHLGVLQAFLVFSFGMLASTATPTPGGLVGAEAGLYAGFVAYGAAAAPAGAAVLLYRLISYWLPLLPSFFALVQAHKRKLV